MIAGHLREKDGHYYCVLSYTDYTGERRNGFVNLVWSKIKQKFGIPT